MENGWDGEGTGVRFGRQSSGDGDEMERGQTAMPGTGRAGLAGERPGCPGWIFGTGSVRVWGGDEPGLLGWGCGKGWGWARRREGEQSGGEGRRGAGAGRAFPAAMRGSPPGCR